MKNFSITEEGNGPWCDPIEAASLDAALAIVLENLENCHPTDYEDDWEDGDDLPQVKITIRGLDSGETVSKTLTVGSY